MPGNIKRDLVMKFTALLTFVCLISAYPVMARQNNSRITCDIFRAYVAQVGLQQAKAAALSAGMTASEEREAKRCLAGKL
jgi:hypothetical protein